MTSPLNNIRLKSNNFSTLVLRGLLAGFLVLGAAGCNKTGNSTSQKVDAADPAVAATLAELTQALRKYAMEHHGLPKNFAELVAAGYVKNPPVAPVGMQFEIDPKAARIVLLNQSTLKEKP